jgi:hypothetical protein
MTANALGFHGKGMAPATPRSAGALPAPANAPSAPVGLQCGLAVPRGLLPVLLYSGFAFALPFLSLYGDIDYASDGNKAGAIAVAAVAALAVGYANCCRCWFNMMLFFHLALEVRVVDLALSFAYADGTSATDASLAVVAAVVVIAHLVPFLLVDRVLPLSVLAGAGVVVNAAAVVYLDASLLLLVGASSVALLALTLVVGGVCEVRTSLLTLLLDAVRSGDCIKCGRYEL